MGMRATVTLQPRRGRKGRSVRAVTFPALGLFHSFRTQDTNPTASFTPELRKCARFDHLVSRLPHRIYGPVFARPGLSPGPAALVAAGALLSSPAPCMHLAENEQKSWENFLV